MTTTATAQKRESLINHLTNEQQEDIRIVVRLLSALCPPVESIYLYEELGRRRSPHFSILGITNDKPISMVHTKVLKTLITVAKEFNIFVTGISLEIRDITKQKAEFDAKSGFVHRAIRYGIPIYDRELKTVDYL